MLMMIALAAAAQTPAHAPHAQPAGAMQMAAHPAGEHAMKKKCCCDDMAKDEGHEAENRAS